MLDERIYEGTNTGRVCTSLTMLRTHVDTRGPALHREQHFQRDGRRGGFPPRHDAVRPAAGLGSTWLNALWAVRPFSLLGPKY